MAIEEGKAAPAFALKDAEGNTAKLVSSSGMARYMLPVGAILMVGGRR